MQVRAVLFDFGGTLYDYRTLEKGDREALLELVRSSGIDASSEDIRARYRAAMRRVFHAYVPKRYYLQRDLFRDAVVAMLESFDVTADPETLEAYRARQWEAHRRDFQLRPGVPETLQELRRRGLHLGIVSNIDKDQLAHMGELAHLPEFFDSILSSEEAGSCKPDPGIFEHALRSAGCRAEEALFVGDTLAQDVAGANGAGLRSVLLWHREDRDPPDGDPVPHHVIRGIPEILALLEPTDPSSA